jgi:tetratricopeptide (TPR) repeat protein
MSRRKRSAHHWSAAQRSMICSAIMWASAAVAHAQSQSGADSAFAKSDWATAAREYRMLAERDTANLRARFRLGVALFEQRQFRAAIPALERAAKGGFQVSQAEMRLARAQAQLGARDSALTHLKRAIDAGVRLEVVAAQDDFAALRSDARYIRLLRALEDSQYPCRNGVEARQFDFWIGEWVVTPWGAPALAPAIGHNTIRALLEHCLLLEEWTPSSGGDGGKSFNFWDTNRRVWRQIWTAVDGGSLDYEGQYAENAMRFHGWTVSGSGKRILQKLTFFRISADTVRQLFEASEDGGATWRNTFDGRYVRVRASPAR